MLKLILFPLFCCFSILLAGQELNLNLKNYTSVRISSNIQIDAVFDEPDWNKASISSDFIQNEPVPGIPATQKTTVKILYDDKAIYVAAMLFDESPDSILHQLSERDEVGLTDWFAVILDPYQDGLNGSGFAVTAAGVQFDTKYSSIGGRRRGGRVLGGDSNWDAVWQSEIRYTGDGWAVEMRIPYSALRFPKVEVQTWNINFARMVRRTREQSYWNEVKPEISGLLNQSGKLLGIKDIKSPVRLSATPFIVTYVENYVDKNENPKSIWGKSFNGGMDIKYGINDAFTLDMTLIPDFGQTQSDNQILNLSPFEVRFDENRQFFTEGTELFNKGGLFYSRRIGGRPLHFYEVEDQISDLEEVVENPSKGQLINASKVSGRTKGGLGIGVFNATSAKTYATVENTETGERRDVQTDPLTNYNVFVLDQNLKNNSYVSLINTNVWRFGSDYEANVTGTDFSLKNKDNSYALGGTGAVNQKYFKGVDTDSGKDSIGIGYTYRLEFEKTRGNFKYGIQYRTDSRHYDINDLGFNFRPNQKTWSVRGNYNIFKPFGPFNRAGAWSWIQYSRLQEQNKFTDFEWNLRSFLVTKNFFSFGLFGTARPFKSFDYYEPRTDDYSRFYTLPANAEIGVWGSTDFRKKVALEFNTAYTFFNESGRRTMGFELNPKFRFNDKLFFELEVEHENRKNDVGYVGINEDGQGFADVGEENITLSRRNQIIFENTLSGNYIFTNKMSLTLRARHYWTRLEYQGFNLLETNGDLGLTSYLGLDDQGTSLHNTSFNIFNVDMVYRWRFAPGSDIFFVWKNSIFKDSDDIDKSYLFNLKNLLDSPQLNSFSFKIVYYLDYLDLKHRS